MAEHLGDTTSQQLCGVAALPFSLWSSDSDMCCLSDEFQGIYLVMWNEGTGHRFLTWSTGFRVQGVRYMESRMWCVELP